MNRDTGGPSSALFAGIVFIIVGALGIITDGGGVYRGSGLGWIIGAAPVPVVDWIGWILLPSGIVICIMSIIALLRGEGKPKEYTDEDLARFKEELDRMYFEEHGFLPHQHGSPLDETNHKKDAQAKNPEQ